jgi:hypothetical protein
MANLYDIDAAILACVDLETGEIIDEEQLQALQLEREQKIEQVALWHKNLLSDAAQYAAEEAAFKKKKQVAQAKAERLKAYLQDALQGDKYKSTRVSITYRTTPRVIVDDVLNLPPRFVRFPAPEPNKTEIMAAIKGGEEINGAHLESNQSIIIK